MKKSNLTHKLAAALTVATVSSVVTDAFATGLNTDFNDMSNNVIQSTNSFSGLINTAAYLAGTAFGVAGIFKLKQHVDSPAQHAMKDGLIRLGAGGGLLGFPFVVQSMQGAIANGNLQQLDTNAMKVTNTTGFQN